MSTNASTWARAQLVRDGYAKALLKEYAHWASEDYSTWASNPTLIASLEMDIKTIRRCRDKLIELGFLVETKRRSGGTGNIVVYQMIAPPGTTVVQAIDRRTGETVSLSPPSIEEYQAKQDQKRSPSKSGAPKGNQKRSPSKNGAPPDSDARGTKNGSEGVPDFPEGGPNTDPDFSELGSELSELGETRASGVDETGKTAHPPDDEKPEPENRAPGFERFWTAWPAASGRKQARDVCRSHWIANGLEPDTELIVMHVEAMKRTQHWKTGGDPTPIRYLEGRRWRDCTVEEIEASIETQQLDDDTPWFETLDGVEARARQISMRDRKPDEDWRAYRVVVVKAVNDRKAAEYVLKDAQRFNNIDLYQFARRTFGDALMPVDDYAS